MAPLHLHRLPGCDLPGVSDADLVARFVADRDEAAFELLAYRHGPMVWATCRRVLSNHHAAEDAFQATFLVLARKAAAIRRTTSVAAWLHRVAVRAGLDLRRRKPLATEPLAAEPIEPRPGPVARAEAAELARDFDAAVNGLPARLRHAFILCDLQGHPLAAAAALLRCPQGTVESRLTRARRRLRKRFAAYALGGLVAARVPGALHAAVLRREHVTAAVVALARRAGSPTFGFALPGLATVVAAGFLVAAFGQADPPKQAAKPPQVEAPKGKDENLPPGAIARLGSDRFRHGGNPMGPPAFSLDGKQLAVADTKGVTLFETATGRRLSHFPGADKLMPKVVRFLADGKRLAVGWSDWRQAAAVAVYDLTDGKVLRRADFKAAKNQIFVIDVTPDGDRALVADWFQKVFLWDVPGNREVWAIDHPEASFPLPFTADGKAFVLAGSRKADLRDAVTGAVIAPFDGQGRQFPGFYSAAAVSASGRLAHTVGDRGPIEVIDARRKAGPIPLPPARETERLRFSPDEKYLVGFGRDETRVFDLTAPADKAVVAKLPAAHQAAFTPDGKTLALDDFGIVTLWDTADWKCRPESADPASLIRGVRFTADGTGVVGLTRHGWVRWPLGGGPGVALSDDSPTNPDGYSDVSADGRIAVDILYTAGKDRASDSHALRVTDLTTRKARRISLDTEPRAPIRVSPDGRHVFGTLGGRRYVIWDAATGAELHRTVHEIERVLFGAYLAADGKSWHRSVTGVFRKGALPGDAMYEAVFLTDHSAGKEWKLDPAPWGIYSGGAYFSADGTRVAIRGHFGYQDEHNRLLVMDATTGRRLCDVPVLSGYVNTTPLSADGRSVVNGNNSGELVITEVATGGPRVTFRHAGVILSAAFHPDGTRVVASSAEAPVYVWDLLGKPGPWDTAKADAVWADLASPDAKVAFAAIRLLRANPAAAVVFLRDRVKVAAVPTDATVADQIKQLDAKEFAGRERAEKALVAAAELVKSRLEAERQRTTSAEVRERLDRVLRSTDDLTADRLRAIRACEVLEGIGGPEAVKVLKVWAGGPAAARLTVEAAESLRRIER